MNEERARPQTPDTGTVDAENPWPGLAAFREADELFFQGRETVVDELTRMVLRSRVTVLHGVSGLGKTSVLRAGVFPRLRREAVLPIYVRLSHADESAAAVDQIFEAIAHAAGAAGVEAPPPRASDTLWEYFHRRDARFWDARNRIVRPLLVFDQFEEAFTLGHATAARRARTDAFLSGLSDLVEGRPAPHVKERLENDPEEALRFSLSDQPCKVLLSLREDFLPDLAELRGRMPAITDTMYRLQPMTTAEALRVVEVDGGRLVDHGVAEEIVRFVAAAKSEPGIEPGPTVVEPALLSVFCRELNSKRLAQGGEKITADLLEGSRSAIISDFYERTISEGGLGPAVRIFVEEELVTASGFRDNVAEEQALTTAGIDRADIEALIARRLLRREDTGTRGRSRLELTHDVLAPAVRASRDQRRLREQEQRAVAERRALEERAQREAQEARAAAETAQALARQEQRAREAAERLAALERRTRKRQIAMLSLVLLATGTLAWFARNEARRANVAEAAANRALAASDVDRVVRGEPWALALLARAVRNDPASPLARALLIGYLSQQVIPIAEMSHQSPVIQAAINAGGTRVLTVSGRGTARLWDARTGDAIGGALGAMERVTVAAFSPDGARVLTASSDGAAQVWDAVTGGALGDVLRHDGGVTAATFDQAGARLVTASDDGTVTVWNPGGGTPLTIRAAAEPVIDAAFDPSGRYVLSISSSGDAALWDLHSDAEVAGFGHGAGSPEGVVDATFSSDGGRIVAVLMDGRARIIETSTGRVSATLHDEGPIFSARFDPAAERVVTLGQGAGDGAAPGLVRFWDPRTGARLPLELRHGGWISSVEFSPDGALIVTASQDGSAQVWEAVTGQAVAMPLQHARAVVWAGFSPDGERVLTASEDGTAQLWNATTGMPRGNALRHDGPVVAAGFSADGAVALTASSDRTARLWDARTGVPVETCLKPANGVRIDLAAFSGDGQLVATAGSLDPNLSETDRDLRGEEEWLAQLWDVATGAHVGAPLRHDNDITSLAFSAAGAPRLVTTSADGTARLWNVPGGEPVAVMKHDALVYSAVFSRDGTRLITASADRTARLWDGSNGRPIASPLVHATAVVSAAFSPDGATAVTVGTDERQPDGEEVHTPPHLWNATTGESIGTLEAHDAPVVAVAFSPDGGRILTSSADYSHLWDASTGRPIGQRLRHRGAVTPPVFNHDGAEVVTTSWGSAAWVWDVRGEPILRGQLRRPDTVMSAAFSPDGRLMTASSDGTARIWNARTREDVGLALYHDSEIRWAVFSGDGSRVLTLAADGTARIWDVPAGTQYDADLLIETAETIGGLVVSDDGSVNHVEDHATRLAALREQAATGGQAGQPSAASFVHWLFADPASRTISPLSRITVPEYVARLLGEGARGRVEARRLFPGHPGLRAGQANHSQPADKVAR